MLAIVLAIPLAAAQDQGAFRRDVDALTLTDLLLGPTFAYMSPGEAGYALRGDLCFLYDRLNVVAASPVRERMEWTANLKVVRQPQGFEGVIDVGEKAADPVAARRAFIVSLAEVMDCVTLLPQLSFDPVSAQLIPVSRIDGVVGLSALAGLAMSETPTDPGTFGEVDDAPTGVGGPSPLSDDGRATRQREVDLLTDLFSELPLDQGTAPEAQPRQEAEVGTANEHSDARQTPAPDPVATAPDPQGFAPSPFGSQASLVEREPAPVEEAARPPVDEAEAAAVEPTEQGPDAGAEPWQSGTVALDIVEPAPEDTVTAEPTLPTGELAPGDLGEAQTGTAAVEPAEEALPVPPTPPAAEIVIDGTIVEVAPEVIAQAYAEADAAAEAAALAAAEAAVRAALEEAEAEAVPREAEAQEAAAREAEAREAATRRAEAQRGLLIPARRPTEQERAARQVQQQSDSLENDPVAPGPLQAERSADLALLDTAGPVQSGQGRGSGDWTVLVGADDETGRDNVYISRPSSTRVIGRTGDAWAPILTLRCWKNTSSVSIGLEDTLTQIWTPVTYALDTDRTPWEAWGAAADARSLGLWSGRSAIPFMRRLAESDQLSFEIENDDVTYSFTFDVNGLRPHVSRLAAACNWSL
ncbi:MAG: type VI secretion system-associated protein TagO [Pseudomonadota bacterium]